MRSRSDGVASIGTRSLSCRFTPQAPTSASIETTSTGEMCGRVTSPNGSRPRLASVHNPKENLCSGFGLYDPFLLVMKAYTCSFFYDRILLSGLICNLPPTVQTRDPPLIGPLRLWRVQRRRRRGHFAHHVLIRLVGFLAKFANLGKLFLGLCRL